MQVFVNNESTKVPENFTVQNLLENMGLNRCVAVFINGVQILQREYVNHLLKDKDKIKIIKPLAGG